MPKNKTNFLKIHIKLLKTRPTLEFTRESRKSRYLQRKLAKSPADNDEIQIINEIPNPRRIHRIRLVSESSDDDMPILKPRKKGKKVPPDDDDLMVVFDSRYDPPEAADAPISKKRVVHLTGRLPRRQESVEPEKVAENRPKTPEKAPEKAPEPVKEIVPEPKRRRAPRQRKEPVATTRRRSARIKKPEKAPKHGKTDPSFPPGEISLGAVEQVPWAAAETTKRKKKTVEVQEPVTEDSGFREEDETMIAVLGLLDETAPADFSEELVELFQMPDEEFVEAGGGALDPNFIDVLNNDDITTAELEKYISTNSTN